MNVPNRAPWMNIAVGILTIISPWMIVPVTNAARVDLVITGIVIAVVAIIEMSVYAHAAHRSYWSIINILAGIWLFISTTYVAGTPGLVWSVIVLGVMSIVTAWISLSYEKAHTTTPTTHSV